MEEKKEDQPAYQKLIISYDEYQRLKDIETAYYEIKKGKVIITSFKYFRL